MSRGNIPSDVRGRRAYGMDTRDWEQLASAYDTWNEHLPLYTKVDEDIRAYVYDIFSEYDLWDEENNVPDLRKYRSLVYNRC